MSFRIHALPESQFRHLFDLSDEELAGRSARRMIVDDKPGFPCRVSLTDAEIGDTVILLNYEHLAEDTPYRASHAIFVIEGAQQAHPAPGEVPEVLRPRLLSVRAFDRQHQMTNADVVPGGELETCIETMFADAQVDYLHVHNAMRGCYAARVTRA